MQEKNGELSRVGFIHLIWAEHARLCQTFHEIFSSEKKKRPMISIL